MYCLFRAHAIACAAIYFTAIFPPPGCPAEAEEVGGPAQRRDFRATEQAWQTERRQICLPYEPAPWYELLDVDEGELREICTHLMELYNSHPIPRPQPAVPSAQPTVHLRGVVEHYASDKDSDEEMAEPTSADEESVVLDAWARSAAHSGLASRVRDEWGGMISFARDRHLVTEYASLLNSSPSCKAEE